MSDTFNPARDGHALDKLRHTEPRTARKLQGVGSRAKQYAALRDELQRKRGPTGSGDPNRLNVNIVGARRERLTRLRGTTGVLSFLDAAMDAYERQQSAPDTGERYTPECAAIIAQEQQKYGLTNDYDTLTELVARAEKAESRATRIRELEEQLNATRDEMQPALLNQPLMPETEDCLFDFITAFTGATARADASGEVIVTASPAALGELFAVWAHAVKVLNVAARKKDGVA